ncbi:MAG TPA: hypothetical protein VFE33_26155 [Thermoanaerobaculia bacterium]|nr:hypothetical protein [Thermoanaerobaculia bacterium]
MVPTLRRTALFLALLALPRLAAAVLPCAPCAGVRLTSPDGVLDALKAQYQLKPGSPLFVAWDVSLAGGAAASPDPGPLAQAGATPWISLVFTTPAPLAKDSAHLTRLQGELQAAAQAATSAPAGSWFQVVWRPEGQEAAPQDLGEYGFLLKRAAVTLTGARTDAKVATEALPADAKAVAGFYAQEVAAYLEALVLRPGTPEEVAAAVAAAGQADPGRTVVLDAIPLPADPREAVAEAARWTVRGISLTLFNAASPVTTATLVPFALLAREFSGDLSYDPTTVPSGPRESWVFVRGKDLGLRMIAVPPEGAANLALRFSDSSLRRPVRYPLAPGKVPPPSGQVTKEGLEVALADPGPVAVLGLDRLTAEERKGVAEKVTVAGEREIPVEEILRRLQAFEDAQNRRLDHYQAVNATHLRFQLSGTATTFEATLEGPFFFRRGAGTDWAWENLYLNGVRWRGKSIPEIPLVQPEKAAALPLEIHFTKEYRYRLRGSDRINGRDAWVIDFSPEGAAAESGKLYRGSVWVDKQLYARLRTKAVQVGLTGDVISNEETQNYRPIDAQGQPAAWSAESFVLPLNIVAQQILSVVNSTTVVERATDLSNVRINGEGFEEARRQVEASKATMVRDTEHGLRYLVPEGEGKERVVKEGFAKSKLFAIGGLFYDSSLSYPLPLAGLNYFSLDFKGTGEQVNVFFAGALLTANVAQPRLFGSRFDAGASAFAIALPLTDNLFRNGKEITREEIKSLPATFTLKLGRPLGDFVKLTAEYGLFYSHYKRDDNTDPTFVLPSNNLLQSFALGAQYARSGYKLNLDGSYNRRSKWEFWGLPGNTEFDPKDKDFVRWQASLAKSWYFPGFKRLGVELDYDTGTRLDRFSKYQFGFFGDTRVHGFQSNRVRAETAVLGHLTYGFEINETLRLDGVFDYALATDKLNGLNHEPLGGFGIVGSFMGPWETLVNIDAGFPVIGPANGFVAYVAFLKLFK